MPDKQDSDTLLMVFTIFRHGDRGPLIFVPNDKNKDYWENQIGLLTNEGKQQAYKLGLWHSQRYENFLPKIYNSNDVYVHSTNIDRTLMTAQCVLAGLYEPIGPNQWHDTIPWQPIPVHTTSSDMDLHTVDLIPFSSERPIPQELCQTEKHLNLYKNYLQFQPTFEKWFKYFYGNMEMRFDHVLLSAEGAYINKTKGLSIEIPPEVEDFTALVKSVISAFQLGCEVLPFYNRIGSDMLDVVLNSFKEKIDNKKQIKMYLYSAHDINLFTVLNLLNINRPRTQYCGFLTFELHKLADGKHYVKLQHQLKYDSDLTDLPLADDQLYCPLETFENIVIACRKKTNV